jgi:hypothetical protein
MSTYLISVHIFTPYSSSSIIDHPPIYPSNFRVVHYNGDYQPKLYVHFLFPPCLPSVPAHNRENVTTESSQRKAVLAEKQLKFLTLSFRDWNSMCNVCRNVGYISTFDAAYPRKPKLQKPLKFLTLSFCDWSSMCNVCRNVGYISTFDAAYPRKPTLQKPLKFLTLSFRGCS